jgi:hypothetical protein
LAKLLGKKYTVDDADYNPISLKKLPKIQIDLYKEPLSNFGKTES